jgi:hypothetical protein
MAYGKSKTYTVRNPNGEFVEVQGRSVDVTPFLPEFKDAELFVHRNNKYPDYWLVSEVTSGRAVAIARKTRRGAIAHAVEELRHQGIDKFNEAIKREAIV